MYFKIINEKDTRVNLLKDLNRRKKYNLIEDKLYKKAIKFIELNIKFRYCVNNISDNKVVSIQKIN